MELIGQYTYTIMKGKNDFIIATYQLDEVATTPDGKAKSQITVKGYRLPELKSLTYKLIGDFEPYSKDGKTSYTFNVTTFEEVMPTEEEKIVAYLTSLKGVGPKTAERMYEAFEDNIFDVIENDCERLKCIKGLSSKTLEKISTDYARRKSAQKLFSFLFNFNIKDRQVMKIHKVLGPDALDMILENPYVILQVTRIGFSTADVIARKQGIPLDSKERIKAGILEVLLQGERGGKLFDKRTSFPSFVYDGFLTEKMLQKFNEESFWQTQSTYLESEVLYIHLLQLLNIPISYNDYENILVEMHQSKDIFLAIEREPYSVKVYRYYLANAEYHSAKKLAELLSYKVEPPKDLLNVLYRVEKTLSIRLSDEQQSAVRSALENPVTIITGGPGVGKTSVEKAILETFRKYYPNESVLLAAPTGRAAKRMSESTGFQASTLHKALQLIADDDGNSVELAPDFMFEEKLIIVDEASMIGAVLFDKLVSHIKKGTQLVIIGDPDQLPSIEVGSVLSSLIESKMVPIKKLTRTFRQASGSVIATNAARVRDGNLKLEYNSEFQFLADENSDAIQQTVLEKVKRLIDTYGEDEVMVLTSYRKSTSSGANALNVAIRNEIRSDITENTPYFEKKGIKFYEGDKVMFTKNTEVLTNGDIGKISQIIKTKDGLIVNCLFDDLTVPIEDDDTEYLDLAYATTIHKAQGSEAKAVIMVTDIAHKVLLSRSIFYTGLTRAEKTLYIVGQPSALQYACNTVSNIKRNSQLGKLVKKFYISD